MFNVKARKVTRRGMSHIQRCEDESLIFSYNQIAVLSVFDGCSSGTDSYFASGLLAKILKKIAIQNKSYFESINEQTILSDVSYFIIKNIFDELKYTKDYLEIDLSEILSTIVLSVVNIKTKDSYTVMIGDGSIYVDGQIYTIQPEENKPLYMAYFLQNDFEHFWQNNVSKHLFKIDKTIAVLTDGIDSFKNYKENRYISDDEKQDIIKRFFESGYLLNNKVGLARICNILDDEKISPSDDLSIAHITFVEIIEENETI